MGLKIIVIGQSSQSNLENRLAFEIKVKVQIKIEGQGHGGQDEALLGGVHAPCSLRHFSPFSMLPSIFQHSLLFTNFHCSFFIFLCSLLLLIFSSCSLIISLAPCSIYHFFAAPCSLFKICVLHAPRLCFPCSLLPSSF